MIRLELSRNLLVLVHLLAGHLFCEPHNHPRRKSYAGIESCSAKSHHKIIRKTVFIETFLSKDADFQPETC